MKNTLLLCRYKRRSCGLVLALMLVLVGLTSLLASAGLERTKQYGLLISALSERAALHEKLSVVLAQGIAYTQQQLRFEDFYTNKRGLYSEVQASRAQHYDHQRIVPAEVQSSGFLIELLSRSEVPLVYQSRHHLACRLLVTAQVATDNSHLTKQALLETTLPAHTQHSTNTILVVKLPPTKVVATRMIYQ